MSDEEDVLRGVRAMLRLAGRDPEASGVARTPERVLRAWLEQTAAPGDPATLLSVNFGDAEHYDQMIAVGPVEFSSICEHHLLPFTGHAYVAYIPNGEGVVGLSKLARLVDHYARQPQIQERMTEQIVTAIEKYLRPSGAACMIVAQHTCMSLRGVQKREPMMVTSSLTGPFKSEGAVRAEFFALRGVAGG